jgi:hypothetical protein
MDLVEQRIVVNIINIIIVSFLPPKGLGYKSADEELSSITEEQAYSFLQTTRWIRGFKDDDLSSGDENR